MPSLSVIGCFVWKVGIEVARERAKNVTNYLGNIIHILEVGTGAEIWNMTLRKLRCLPWQVREKQGVPSSRKWRGPFIKPHFLPFSFSWGVKI